tara:strand:- start:72 stop:329 length:258 start_codon:yes stop_codon:yes gene_type:complete
MISKQTNHLTHEQVVDRIKKRKSLRSYLDDFTENNPNIYEKTKVIVNEKIDQLCDHDIVDDLVEECAGDVLIEIKYCRYCEMTFH